MELSNGTWISVPSEPREFGPAGADATFAWSLLLGVLAILAVALLGRLAADVRRGAKPRRSPRWRPRGDVVPFRAAPRPEPRAAERGDKVDQAAAQLRAVNGSDYERTPILNRSEARLVPLLDRVVREAGRGHRLWAQIALNEAIRPVAGAAPEALGAIVAKRLDFAIFDRRGMIVCALEYQGEGHWQDHAAFRDAVKREALRKAGVRLIEVHPDFAEATLVQSIRDAMAEADPSLRPAATG